MKYRITLHLSKEEMEKAIRELNAGVLRYTLDQALKNLTDTGDYEIMGDEPPMKLVQSGRLVGYIRRYSTHHGSTWQIFDQQHKEHTRCIDIDRLIETVAKKRLRASKNR